MKRSANALFLVPLAGLLLLGTILLLVPGGETPRAASVLSSAPDGRRALLLMLEELAYDARPWTEAPGDLPDGGATLVLSDVPPRAVAAPSAGTAPGASGAPGTGAAPSAGAPGPTLHGRRDPRHYRRFLEAGGLLVAPASLEMRTFLGEELGLEAPRALTWVVPSATLGRVTLAGGEELEVDWKVEAAVAREPEPAAGAVLARDLAGEGVALRFPVGRGALLLLSPSRSGRGPFENGRLGLEQHGLLFVRLLEAAGAPRRVLFDEYALGGWTPESPLELAFSRRTFALAAHLGLFLLLVLWRVAWVRSFPRDPEPLAEVSALSRARALARLLERARRYDLLAAMLARGPPDGAAGRDPAARARREALLAGRTVADRAGLEDFAAELARLAPAASQAHRA